MSPRWGKKAKPAPRAAAAPEEDTSLPSFATIRTYQPQQPKAPEAPRRTTKKDTPKIRGSQPDSSNTQYVRSRTISAYAPVINPDLNRLSHRELQTHRRRLLRGLAISLIVVGMSALLVSQFTASIGQVSYSPAVSTTPNEAKIKSVINDYYSSRPLERFRFLLNEKTLGEYLANKLPEVQGVQGVDLDGIGSSRVALSMRTPVASWNVSGTAVYVDSNGVSFTHDYYAAPSVTVDDESGASTAGSATVASSSEIRYIGQLIAALKANGTGTVTKVVLPAGMVRELDIYLEGRAYRVKVQLDRDITSQAADVKSAVTYLDAHGGVGQYIDVRVPGKAYYL